MGVAFGLGAGKIHRLCSENMHDDEENFECLAFSEVSVEETDT